MNNANSPEPSPSRGSKLFGLLILLGLLGIGVAVVLNGNKPPMIQTPPGAATTNNPLSATAAGFGALTGRWYRTDGDYLLEIKKAGEDGQLEAAYLNPQPIHVAKAEAKREGSLIKVMVELRDTGYPGCLYTLLYDQPKDILRGTYYQAALGETYEVSFDRVK